MGKILDLFADLFFPINISFWIWRWAIYEKSRQIGLLPMSGWERWVIVLAVSIVLSAIVKYTYDEECFWGSIAAGFAPIGFMLLLFGDSTVSWIVLKIILTLMASFVFIQVSRIIYGKSIGRCYKELGTIIKWLMGKLFRIGVFAFSIASIILVVADVKTTVVRSYIKQGGVAKNITVVEDKIFSSNTGVLEKLKKENWYKASLAEKEEACYELMQLYMIYFTGTIDEDTRMIVGNDFKDEVLGYYEHSKNYVLIDRQYIEDNGSYEYCLNCVAHETYHWLEFEVLDYGKEKDLRNLVPGGHLNRYKYEFENYVPVEKDREAYYKQLCEKDAFDFADRVTPQVLKLIESI